MTPETAPTPFRSTHTPARVAEYSDRELRTLGMMFLSLLELNSQAPLSSYAYAAQEHAIRVALDTLGLPAWIAEEVATGDLLWGLLGNIDGAAEALRTFLEDRSAEPGLRVDVGHREKIVIRWLRRSEDGTGTLALAYDRDLYPDGEESEGFSTEEVLVTDQELNRRHLIPPDTRPVRACPRCERTYQGDAGQPCPACSSTRQRIGYLEGIAKMDALLREQEENARYLGEPFAACDSCASAGGAFGNPDAPWRPAVEGESCEAADHDGAR